MASRSTTTALDLLRRIAPQDAAAVDSSRRPFPMMIPGLADPGSRLLVIGCGHSGTHAIYSTLQRHAIAASHEGIGRQATVGWMYAADGTHPNASDLWTFRNKAPLQTPHDPIIKIHRDPLFVIAALANGFTENGKCYQGPYDALSWNVAARFIPLPEARAISRGWTCRLDWDARVRMALHYWVKWNLLSDRWATMRFQVENLTFSVLASAWCAHCQRVGHCQQVPTRVCKAGAVPTGKHSRVRETRGGHNSTSRPMAWNELAILDPGMTLVARLLADEYGYAYPQAPMVIPSTTLPHPSAYRRSGGRAV